MTLNRRGITLVECMFALLIATLLFSSLIVSSLAFRSLSSINKHYIQAVNVARGAIERIHGLGYGAAVDSTWNQAFDAGSDGAFGTGDDLTGTVTIQVKDFLDMDQDGNKAEQAIDLDGDGVNDTARPLRATFEWKEHLSGKDRNFSVWLDALIVA